MEETLLCLCGVDSVSGGAERAGAAKQRHGTWRVGGHEGVKLSPTAAGRAGASAWVVNLCAKGSSADSGSESLSCSCRCM